MAHVAGAQTKKDVRQSEEEGSKDDAKNCVVKTTDKMEPSSSVSPGFQPGLSPVQWDDSVGTPHVDEAGVVGQKLPTGTSHDSPVASGKEGPVAQAQYTKSTDEDAAEVPVLLPQQQLRLKLALKTGTAALQQQDTSWVEPHVVHDTHILLDLIEGAEHPPEEPEVTAVRALMAVQQDMGVFVDVCLDVDSVENPCAKQPDKSPKTNQKDDVPAVPSLSSLAPPSSLPPNPANYPPITPLSTPYHPPITPQTLISHKHILLSPPQASMQQSIIQRSVSYSAPQAVDHSLVPSANPQSEKRPVENAQALANLNVESWDVLDVFAFLTALGKFSSVVAIVVV
jgi:hypothetical protein